MKKITLVAAEPGAGHAIELGLGLREYAEVTSVWRKRSSYKFDYLEPQGIYGFGNIPPEGDEIIIVASSTFNFLRKNLRNFPGGLDGFLKGYNEVKIVVTDDKIMFDPVGWNILFKNYQVWATICKIHFRGTEPTKPYYRPFDLSHIECGRQIKTNKLLVAHSPFVAKKRREKGSDKIEQVIKKMGVNYDLIMGVSWDEAIRRKAKAHIFVDQIDHAGDSKFQYLDNDYTWMAWGKSGDEAMHLKCLVMSGGADQDIGHSYPPIAWCGADNFEDVLSYYIDNPVLIQERANEQYEWQMKYGTRDYAARNLLNLL